MITGKLTVEDYLAAQWLHRKRKVLISCSLCGIAILVGLGFLLFRLQLPAIIFLGGGAGGLGGMTVSSICISWKARRIFKQHRDFDSPFTYKWDESLIYGEGVSGSSKRPWGNYSKVKEDEQLFLLYHSDVLFEMLPKRWFHNTEQLQQFRMLVTHAK